VNNGAKTITLGGNLTTSGANNVTLTTGGATNVTLPTSGTLAALSGANSWTGTQTFQKDDIKTTATNGAVLANTTASDATNTVQQSPSAEFDAHVWNTTTSADNTETARLTLVPVSGATPSANLTWAMNNNGGGWTNLMSLSSAGNLSATTFTGSGSGLTNIPAANITGTLPAGVLSNITTTGTVTSGTWQGTAVGPTYGGTGVNNGSNTITLGGGNFAMSGGNDLTFTTTGPTNVTLPTSGTLVNSAVATLSSLSSIGTITTGVWNGSVIAPTYGGTGQTSLAASLVAMLPDTTNKTLLYLQVKAGGGFRWNDPTAGAQSFGVGNPLAINSGGTGQTTRAAAIKALLPDTTSNTGKFLQVKVGGGIDWATASAIDLTAANSWTGTQTFEKDNIKTSATTSAAIKNATASDAVNTVQQSPSVEFNSHVWNTTSTSDNAIDARLTLIPVSGATPSANLTWSMNNNGGGYSNVMALSSAGNLTATTFTGSGSGLTNIPAANITGTLPAGVLSNITSTGTITSGTWQGTAIAPAYGGTGVNNGSNTVTLGANFAVGGANAVTLTGAAGGSSVTLPASGTLVNSAVATLSSLASIGTITTGVWNGTVVNPTYGGTGVNNGSNTLTLGANMAVSGANAVTFTGAGGGSSVTLPASGTLVNSAVTTLSSLASIGTITTGVWHGSVIDPLYGGTGNNGAAYATGGIFYYDGTKFVTVAPDAVVGKVLSSNGTGNPPVWISASGSGTVTNIASGAGLTGGPITTTGTIAIDYTSANTWTGTQTFKKDAIGTTATTGAALNNTTAATGGATVQQSPSLDFNAHVWNTNGGGSDNTFAGRLTLIPSSGNPPTGKFSWAMNNNGGGWVEKMSLASDGNLTATTFTGSGAGLTSIPASQVTGTLPAGVLSNITSTGTITSGTWQGTAISPTYGGTGVNNGSNTVTLGANFAVAGANAVTITGAVGGSSVTLPASGTLVNSAVATLSSLASIGTITTGVWNGTAIDIAHGGTGQTSKTAAFDALSPNTTTGDVTYRNGTNNVRLPVGSTGDVLTVSGGVPVWSSTASSSFTSLTAPNIYGGSAAGSTLNLQSTSSGSPSGDYLKITTGGSERIRVTNSGKVGVGTTTPNVMLDVSGDVATRKMDDTLSNGTNNNVSTVNTSNLRITGPTASFTLTGFTGGYDGKRIHIYNATSQTMFLANQNTSSTDTNRIVTLAGGDIGLVPVGTDGSAIDLIYDGSIKRWVATSVQSNQTTGVVGTPQSLLRGSNRTYTASGLTNDTTLSWDIGANQTWEIDGVLSFIGSASGTKLNLAINIPGTPSTVSIAVQGYNVGTSASNGIGTSLLSANNTGIANTMDCGSTQSIGYVHGIFMTGSSTGTTYVKFANAGSGTLTVQAATFMRVTRIQ
jgi:hypothetical protein